MESVGVFQAAGIMEDKEGPVRESQELLDGPEKNPKNPNSGMVEQQRGPLFFKLLFVLNHGFL